MDEVVAEQGLLVLDEAQEWPTCSPACAVRLTGIAPVRARFLLLGSVSPALMTRVSESPGRKIVVVELAPLTLEELNSNAQRQRHWLMGGFPDGGVLNGRTFPTWQRDYLDLLSKRSF